VSDDVEFTMLAKSLDNGAFAKRVILADKLRRYLWLALGALGLLAAAVLLTLTDTMSIVITLAVVGLVILEVARLGLSEHRREAV
jgi:hypothetical protein